VCASAKMQELGLDHFQDAPSLVKASDGEEIDEPVGGEQTSLFESVPSSKSDSKSPFQDRSQ
jgi:hypothetical protein